MGIRIPLLGAAAFLSAALSVNAQVFPNTSSYAQGFDTLPNTSTSAPWVNDSTLEGWYLYHKNSAAVTTLYVGDGTGNAGGFYSYGATKSSDGVLRGVGSGDSTTWGYPAPPNGAVAGWVALAVTNNTDATITSASLSYSGEQWCIAANATEQTMILQYGFGTGLSSVGSGTTPTANTFSFKSPVTGSTSTGVDGNAAGLVSGRGCALATNWQNNNMLWLRWAEVDDGGNDHGLAIDITSTSASAIPEPSTYAAMIDVAVHPRRVRAA